MSKSENAKALRAARKLRPDRKWTVESRGSIPLLKTRDLEWAEMYAIIDQIKSDTGLTVDLSVQVYP